MLKNYMTQNFTVVELQTEKKGVHVGVEDAVKDVRAILDGKVDKLAPEDLSFIGTLKDIESKLNSVLSKTAASANQTEAQPANGATPAANPSASSGQAPSANSGQPAQPANGQQATTPTTQPPATDNQKQTKPA